MLTHLHIENYAIIEHLDIDFYAGLNTITGETGAGKSILLGALSLLSGGKCDAGVVGVSGDSCVVEGSFDLRGYGFEELFERLDLDYEPSVTIRRVASRTGKSRAFVGDMPVTVVTLREIVDRLVDIHSQHQTLLLSRGEFQREIVDAVAGNGELCTEYRQVYGELSDTTRLLAQTRSAQRDSVARGEFLEFQISQLKSAAIRGGEQQELAAEQRELDHAGEITAALGAATEAFENDETGATVAIKGVINSFGRVGANFAAGEALVERLQSVYVELKDIGGEIDAALERVEANPRRLEQVEQRLDTIYTLCKKHGVQSGDELAAKLQEFETEYETIENSAQNIAQLEAQALLLQTKAEAVAKQLTATRQKAAPKIEKYVVSTLKKLGIKSPRFETVVTPCELRSSGAEEIKFMFSANDGVAMQQIENAASGGEMSRLMLCIKGLVAQKLRLPTIIFDEIDTGVSGSVADAMGEIIFAMSSSMQVINITHLPQVASKGDHHFEVFKDRGTHIKELSAGERVEQIASMLSGSTITEAARSQARTLLGSS